MFYNANFIVRKIENISLSQQTDITNNIINTNQQTINYIDNKFNNNNNIATVFLAPPPLTGYLWQPETTDNVVPGLDSLLTVLIDNTILIREKRNYIYSIINIKST